MAKFFYVTKWKLCIAAMVIVVCIAVSCTKQSEETLKQQGTGVECDTTGMHYSADIVPILQANCYRCHSGAIINGGVHLDLYSNVVEEVRNGVLIGVITHAPGFVPMPFDGGKLSDCNIAKMQAWINEGAPDN